MNKPTASAQPKVYDASFKREAVRLADLEATTDRQVERDLGLYQGAIRSWRTALAADAAQAFPGTGRQMPHDEENRRLRRELDIVRQERDILKKALAIFSKTSGNGSRS